MQSPRTKIVDALKTEPPATLRVKGWVRTARVGKQVAFVAINDGSCLANLQLVAPSDSEAYARLQEARTGAALSVLGELRESPAKGQAVELEAREVEIVGNSDPSYPLQKKRHSFEYLREIAHLRVRSNTFGAVQRVRAQLARAVHEFFAQEGFSWVHTPIITASDCEGAGEMFRVTTLDLDSPPRDEKGGVDESQDFFATPTYLTVSGQLNAEALALGLSEVYTFGPTFRAENSNTSRHAAEFWMIEPEAAWYDLDDDCRLAEAFVKHTLSAVLERSEEDLHFFDQRIEKGLLARLRAVVDQPFERLSYADAVRRLESSGQSFEHPVGFGQNLQAEHERWLCEKDLGRPVFVTDYPKEIKAFYMRRNEDGRTVAAMDLLVPKIGELIGGSQREERLDVLEAAINELEDVDPAEYAWYLDTRRFGTVPHAGFGLGFERLVMWVTGMENIRDVCAFPRTPRACRF